MLFTNFLWERNVTQPLLVEIANKQSLNHRQRQELNNKISKWFIEDIRPSTIVEDEGFFEVIKYAVNLGYSYGIKNKRKKNRYYKCKSNSAGNERVFSKMKFLLGKRRTMLFHQMLVTQ